MPHDMLSLLPSSFSQLDLWLLNFLQCCVQSAHLVITQDVIADTGLQTEGQSQGQVRTQKEGRRASNAYSLPEKQRATDKWVHGKIGSEQRALTCWRAQTDGQVRTRKESDQAGHSLAGEYRATDE
jgi:hypothetical protein